MSENPENSNTFDVTQWFGEVDMESAGASVLILIVLLIIVVITVSVMLTKLIARRTNLPFLLVFFWQFIPYLNRFGLLLIICAILGVDLGRFVGLSNSGYRPINVNRNFNYNAQRPQYLSLIHI